MASLPSKVILVNRCDFLYGDGLGWNVYGICFPLKCPNFRVGNQYELISCSSSWAQIPHSQSESIVKWLKFGNPKRKHDHSTSFATSIIRPSRLQLMKYSSRHSRLFGGSSNHTYSQWDFQGPPKMGPAYGKLPILFPCL